jgi:hypothetical protein
LLSDGGEVGNLTDPQKVPDYFFRDCGGVAGVGVAGVGGVQGSSVKVISTVPGAATAA